MPTTVTCAADRSMRRLSPAWIRWPRRTTAACNRRMKADTVPAWTRPLHLRSGSASGGSRYSSRASARPARSSMTRSPLSGATTGPRRVAFRRVAQHHCARHPGDVDGEAAQLRLDPLGHERDLIAGVGGVGEEEAEQALVDELARGPGEHRHVLAAAGIGHQHVAGARPGRCPQRHRGERAPAPPRGPPARRRLGGEVAVGLVEPEQVLALDVEDQHPQVLAGIADDVASAGEHAQEEQGERGLGGDPADPGDRHVAALAAVEEVEVDEERCPVASQPHRERPVHFVGVQRLVAGLAGGAVHHAARIGCDPHLGQHPGHRHLGRAHLGGGERPSSAMRTVSDSNDAPS